MTTLAQISETQAQKATTANENFAAVSVAGIYGRRPAGTSGLTWGYYGGIFPGNYSAIADGTLSLTGNATNYIEADTATGALSVNTSGWTASGKKRIYSVTTNASAVTAYTDYRTVLDIAAAALAGANTWTGVNTFDEDVIIGSGSPSATLTCNGPVTINSSLTINGWIAGPVSFTGQVTFDEDVVIGSGSPTATLTCNGPVTVNGTLAVEGSVDLTPTGTVTINPATAGAMNNMVIGAVTPLAGSFTALSATSTVYINETSNAGMTLGLTINQGANDNEILAFKSSDVAHGVTTYLETDTYGSFFKYSATAGGIAIRGGSSDAVGFYFTCIYTNDTTTKTTAGVAGMVIDIAKKSGTGAMAAGADANLLAIQNASVTRFIFDAEGSAHADVEWVAFDRFDDVALLNGLDAEMRRRRGDPVKREFGKWVAESRDILQRERIFNFYDDGPRAMMNMTRMHMLEVGAIRQLGERMEGFASEAELVRAEIATLKSRLALIESRSIN